MRDSNTLWKLIAELLEDSCSELWDKLSPEERGKVFRGGNGKASLISEWLEVTF